jgi:transaldolase
MVNAQAIGEYNSEIVTDQILSLVESAISQTKIEMVEKATKMKKIIHQPPDGMNNGDDGIVFRVVYNQAISDLIQSLSKDL